MLLAMLLNDLSKVACEYSQLQVRIVPYWYQRDPQDNSLWVLILLMHCINNSGGLSINTSGEFKYLECSD